MNLSGTPGRTKIVPIDPNNQRVDLDTIAGFSGGTFSQVTVDSTGRVISGTTASGSGGGSTTPSTPSTPAQAATIQAAQGNYSGGQPTFVPNPGIVGLAIDTSNGRLWLYWNNQWN